MLLVLKMILQDFAHLKKYFQDCDYVFESCGVKDDRTQGLFFVLLANIDNLGFHKCFKSMFWMIVCMKHVVAGQRQRMLS